MRWIGAGATLLAMSSALLGWGAWRAWWASGHPRKVTVYIGEMMGIEPAISPGEVVAVVVAVHLLVGAGLLCLARGARSR